MSRGKSHLILVLFFSGFLALSFNNCAPNPANPHAAGPLQSPFMTNEQKIKVLVEQSHNALSADFCNQEKNYSCLHKIHSKSVENSREIEKDNCAQTSQNGKLCPAMEIVRFNTEAASRACTTDCNYEYEEYDCHLKVLSEEGIYPLTAQAPTLGEALEQLSASCLELTINTGKSK